MPLRGTGLAITRFRDTLREKNLQLYQCQRRQPPQPGLYPRRLIRERHRINTSIRPNNQVSPWHLHQSRGRTRLHFDSPLRPWHCRPFEHPLQRHLPLSGRRPLQVQTSHPRRHCPQRDRWTRLSQDTMRDHRPQWARGRPGCLPRRRHDSLQLSVHRLPHGCRQSRVHKPAATLRLRCQRRQRSTPPPPPFGQRRGPQVKAVTPPRMRTHWRIWRVVSA